MGGPVIGPAIGLDLDDPGDATTGRIVSDQVGAEQRTSDVGRLTDQGPAVEDAQATAPG